MRTRLTGSHHDADDLAQETFIRAHRGLKKFRGEARFSTWLTRILLNLSRNPHRIHLPLEAVPEAAERALEGILGALAGRSDAFVPAEYVSQLTAEEREALLESLRAELDEPPPARI